MESLEGLSLSRFNFQKPKRTVLELKNWKLQLQEEEISKTKLFSLTSVCFGHLSGIHWMQLQWNRHFSDLQSSAGSIHKVLFSKTGWAWIWLVSCLLEEEHLRTASSYPRSEFSFPRCLSLNNYGWLFWCLQNGWYSYTFVNNIWKALRYLCLSCVLVSEHCVVRSSRTSSNTLALRFGSVVPCVVSPSP